MAVQPRGIPRFLPTLTEVVHVPGGEPVQEPLDAREPPSFQAPAEQASSVESPAEILAESLRQQVQALIEERLEQIIADALAIQIGDIAARLRHEMQPELRALVDEAMGRPRGRSGPG